MKVAKFLGAVVEQLAAGVVCASDASCDWGRCGRAGLGVRAVQKATVWK